MLRPLLALALITTAPAHAAGRSESPQILPPPGYSAQRWNHPNGCTYSRVGRPGEVAWIVIVNSIDRGDKCARKIVQVPYPGNRPATVRSTKN